MFPELVGIATADPDLARDLLMMAATKFSAAGLLTPDAMGFIGTLRRRGRHGLHAWRRIAGRVLFTYQSGTSAPAEAVEPAAVGSA